MLKQLLKSSNQLNAHAFGRQFANNALQSEIICSQVSANRAYVPLLVTAAMKDSHQQSYKQLLASSCCSALLGLAIIAYANHPVLQGLGVVWAAICLHCAMAIWKTRPSKAVLGAN
jgi:hypothetical protein